MRIEKLEPSRHVRERWLVWFEDGSLLRVTESEVVSFALYQGMELTDGLYGRLSAAAERSAVRARALDLVSARPMSRKELVGKLTEKPLRRRKDGAQREPIATAELAEDAADWLEGLGYLDDGEYAKMVARHYAAKGYGERKTRDELFRRGVPRQYWEAALGSAQGPEEGIDAFLRRRFKGEAPDRKELKRAADALARRGYRWEDIRAGLNRCGAGIEEE